MTRVISGPQQSGTTPGGHQHEGGGGEGGEGGHVVGDDLADVLEAGRAVAGVVREAGHLLVRFQNLMLDGGCLRSALKIDSIN